MDKNNEVSRLILTSQDLIFSELQDLRLTVEKLALEQHKMNQRLENIEAGLIIAYNIKK